MGRAARKKRRAAVQQIIPLRSRGGRRTDQRKGTRLIFLGQDRGCGVPVKPGALSGDANEPGDGDGGPREGSLSCLTVSRKGTASCLAASLITSGGSTSRPSRSRAAVGARKHSTMTLESDRPERGSDDRHNAPASGASGAFPSSRENVLPGKTLTIILIPLYIYIHIYICVCVYVKGLNKSVTSCLSVLITASGLQGEKPLANGIK